VVACGPVEGDTHAERVENAQAGRISGPPGPVTRSDADAAVAAGISEAAVRSQVALAFSALRAELAPLS
jgi:hypothetical protein